jgi:hypothetical protein
MEDWKMRTMMLAAVVAATGLLFGNMAWAEEHVGPHKGAIVEWGEEEYHLELVVDMKSGTATIYVYGGEEDLKKGMAKAIDAKTLTMSLKTKPATTLKLEAKPTKDDPAGKASVFVAKHEVFGKDMKLEGTVSGKVGTKPYSGDFKQK